MARMDYYDILPAGMTAYLSSYGWHFSKRLCDWAVGLMRDRNGNKVQVRTKEQVESILKAYGVSMQDNIGYDAVYLAHMVFADFWQSSIPDEEHLALYVQDVLGDKDGYEGMVLTRFIADCSASGTPIIWEDMI